MFYYLNGTVAIIDLGLVVLECGGVGFTVNTTTTTMAKLRLGDTARLYTHCAIREDAFDIYGFATRRELETFKLLIGVITGLVAHRIGRISLHTSEGPKPAGKVLLWTALASSAGMLFNVIAEPVVSYFYKRYVLGVDADAAAILAKFQSLTTFVNAILTVVIAVALYAALRPALIRAGLFDYNVGAKKDKAE